MRLVQEAPRSLGLHGIPTEHFRRNDRWESRRVCRYLGGKVALWQSSMNATLSEACLIITVRKAPEI